MSFVMPNSTDPLQDPTTYKAALDFYCALGARAALAYAPREQDTPDMTVLLAAGALRSGSTLTEVAEQSTGTITAPSTYPRIDRVVIDGSTGAVSVVTGSEAASPAAPAIPAGKLPVARVDLAVGQTSITNADITDERVPGSGPEIAQDLTSPSAYTVPSTQAVADALDAIPTADETARDHAMRNSLRLGILAGDASGAIPSGYMHLFATDELATKTGARYDSSGKYYANAGTVTPTAAETSSTGSISFYTDVDDLVDGDTVNCLYYAASGATILLTFASAKALNKWTVNHETTGAFYITWTGAGSHVYWRLRWTAEMANSGSASVSWVIEYSDNGSSWTAASTTKSYTANSVVVSIAVEAQGDMTLIPNAITASAHPNTTTVYMLHQAIDSVTYGTDLRIRVSTDGGTNWSAYATPALVCAYDATYSLLKVVVDTSALTGTSVKWEASTANTKSQHVRAVSLALAA